jgi:hypothetical protein
MSYSSGVDGRKARTPRSLEPRGWSAVDASMNSATTELCCPGETLSAVVQYSVVSHIASMLLEKVELSDEIE